MFILCNGHRFNKVNTEVKVEVEIEVEKHPGKPEEIARCTAAVILLKKCGFNGR